MKVSRIKKFICLVSAALLLVSSVSFASVTEVGPGIVITPPEQELFTLVNAKRELKDLNLLEWSDELAVVANQRAKELSERYSHTRPDGSEPQTAYKENGISFSFAGENIAGGLEEAAQVLEKWDKVRASRNNLLRKNFYYAAIGTYDAVAEDGTVTRYWVMEFLTPKGTPVTEGDDIPEGDYFPVADIPDTDNN